MFGLRNKSNAKAVEQIGLDELVRESEKLLNASMSKDFNVTIETTNPQFAQVINNINQTIQNYSSTFQSELLKYKVTQEALNMASWEMDVISGDPINCENTFIWSKEFRQLLGYTTESEFPNLLKSWSDSLHPDDREQTLKSFNNHLIDSKGKAPYNLEYRLKHKTGEYEYYQAIGATLRNRSGIPLKVMGIIRNIQHEKNMLGAPASLEGLEQLTVELKQMKQNIEVNHDTNTIGSTASLAPALKPIMDLVNELLASINELHNHSDFEYELPQLGLWHVAIVDGDLEHAANKWHWSNEFRQLLGFSSERDFPNTFESFSCRVHPSEQKSILTIGNQRVANNNEPSSYDTVLRLMKKNGEYAYFHTFGSVMRDNYGTAIGATGAIEEVNR